MPLVASGLAPNGLSPPTGELEVTPWLPPCLLAGGVCAVRSEDVAPPVEALGSASAALRAGTGVNAVPAAADVGDVGDVGENRT